MFCFLQPKAFAFCLFRNGNNAPAFYCNQFTLINCPEPLSTRTSVICAGLP